VHPHATRDALALLLSTAALFLAPVLLFSKGNRVSSATGLVTALGGIVGAYALLNYLSANETSFHFLRAGFGNRANGPFVNPNHLACYLGVLIGAPLAILFQVHRRSVSREEEPLGTRVADFLADLSRNYRKILAALAFLVMALALVFTLSRSGIVAGAAGVAAFLAAFAVLRRRRRGRRYGRVLAGTALFVVFAGTAAWIGLDPLVRRYASSDLSFGDRWVVWSSSLSLLADFPLFGSGLGTFSDVFPLHQPASIPAHYTYPHSEYVGLLVETGILGALLLAGSAVCGAVGFLRILGRKDLRRTRQLAACVGIAAAVAALVHSAFDFSLHIPAVGMAFAFTLGLGLTASLASESRGRHRSQRGRTGEEEEDEEDEEEAEDVKTAGAITAPEGGDAARGDGAAVPCPGSKPESPAQGGE
jgi:O-antigen ligase